MVDEGQQHFQTEAEALKWIGEQQKGQPCVWRGDGLMICWSKWPPRKQINVDVWQIYINGKKPTNLPGSQDSKIVVEQP